MNSPAPHGVREIAHDSPRYHETARARERILRQPLGQVLTADDTRDEPIQRHFILESGEGLLGGLIARAEGPKIVRLRQMWIEPDHARCGFGRHLLEEVLATLEREGIEQVMLHARVTALGFYRRQGFREDGPEFTEVGIPHRRMVLTLSPEKRSPGCRR